METLFQDLRYGLRTMRTSPGFTAVAMLSLALGIGANTAIFSVVNAVLLRPLPYKEPNRLVAVLQLYSKKQDAKGSLVWSYPKFAVLRDQQRSFEQIAAVSPQSLPLTETDNPERLEV